VPLRCTTEPLRKPVPVTVRVRAGLPATMELGDMLASVGSGLGSSTVNEVALVVVPPGVVTVTRPLVAPVGTTKVSVVASTTVKLLTLVPFNVTAVAPPRLVPTTVTVVPTRPLLGVKLASAGAGVMTWKETLAEVPPCAVLGLATVTS
jgi:hypothetical protein